MKTSIKTSIKWIFFFAILNGSFLYVKCQDRWWQREIPSPSYNQIINPEYLSIKRDLERTLDEQNGLKKRSRQYSSGSNEEREYKRMIGMYEGKMWDLERKLSNTPMYINNPNFKEKTNTENPKANNVTIIVNKQPISASPTSNTKVLDGGGNNVKAKIQLDELKDYISHKTLSIDQKISYYEAFIKDWPNTDAANEAKELLKALINK
jgi:hypothetical protein